MKRPASIQILGKTYKVRVVTERAQGFEEGDYGMCDNDAHVISLVAGRSLGNDQDTLVHEVIHAIAFQMGVDGAINKRENEEKWVQALATGWLAVIKANPTLVRYLQAK